MIQSLLRPWADRLFAAAAGPDPVAEPGVATLPRRTALVVFASLALLYLYAACIELGLSADGAYFFMRALDDHRILVPEPSRVFASLIQMWPVTLAARMGITSLPVLKGLFHLALTLPFLVSCWLCWIVSRPLRNDALLLFPLASQLLVSLPAASILAGQSEVLAAAVWPALLLALRVRLNHWEAALYLLLLALMTRLYESEALTAMVFFGLSVLRLMGSDRTQRPLHLLAGALALAAPLLAVYSTFAEFTPTSQGEFVKALSTPILRYPQLHPMLTLSAFALALLAWAVFVAGRARSWLLAVSVLAALTAIGFGAMGLAAGANVSFNMRTLTFTLLPVMMVMAAGLQLWRRPVAAVVWKAGGLIMVLLTLGYAVSWSAWADYRQSFKNVLAAHSGYVSIDATDLATHSQRWGWTPSVLSVLWSGECVRTIVWTRGSTEWPIHLRQQFPLQAYLSYDPAVRPDAPATCARR